jgi:glycerol uptake operon antiterminator
MKDLILTQGCIPVIATMKQLERFLTSVLKVCVLQDVHVSLLGSMLEHLHAQGRIGLVHIDLIAGLTNDEAGSEFVLQKLRADGLISVKTRSIACAKRNHKLAIQRLFLIDSKSLERGLETLSKAQPDFVEILPGVAFGALAHIKTRTTIPIIAGGLLKTSADLMAAKAAGCSAMTLSDWNLCLKHAYIERTGLSATL